MPDVDQYAPGTPSWTDVSAPDLDAAAAFYGGLFGWDAEETGTVEETGGYRMFTLRGRHVAGLGPTREGGPPPLWTTYISVADAAAACAAATAAGGTVFMEPFDVMGSGRMAVLADPQGAMFCVWQPITHPGARIVNEPGAVVWNELATRETEPEIAFYEAVFGWTHETAPMGGTEYTTWKRDGEMVAGMIRMNEQWPAEIPAHWMVYVAVADVEASCARLTELGGTISVPATEIEIGTFAVVADPNQAFFSMIQMKN
jgi:predicted enzyme related to lactoylglutathione lyase